MIKFLYGLSAAAAVLVVVFVMHAKRSMETPIPPVVHLKEFGFFTLKATPVDVGYKVSIQNTDHHRITCDGKVHDVPLAKISLGPGEERELVTMAGKEPVHIRSKLHHWVLGDKKNEGIVEKDLDAVVLNCSR